MRRLLRPFIALAFASAALLSHAEVLQGIKWLSTLEEVKQVYPNAIYTRFKPAWLGEDEAFIGIKGPGIAGEIRVLFDDSRPAFKKSLASSKDNSDSQDRELFAKLATASDEIALTVSWVRWLPESPLPLVRFQTRYGKPKCDFDDNMSPYCEWTDRALSAAMSDDNKLVYAVTTTFTKAEKRAVYQTKYGWVPDYLK